MDRLQMIGLNSIPSWRQHFGSLSNGQQERCSLALALGTAEQFDGFGSRLIDDEANLNGCADLRLS